MTSHQGALSDGCLCWDGDRDGAGTGVRFGFERGSNEGVNATALEIGGWGLGFRGTRREVASGCALFLVATFGHRFHFGKELISKTGREA
uniref:Uncharacterized protein n=1 Tax=Solibacter usitatus (strain Ellin6076) TaxID=234267 RepID=Q01N75_SOLUE